MQRQSPSIFNDIIGPIMVGPSSSHTCAPARIGKLCSDLLKTKLKKAVIEFAKDGAFTNMYKGQKSDLGFISGLLGRMPEDPKLRTAAEDARKMGVEVTLEISDFEAIVPNIMKITMTDEDGEATCVVADSTGGGTVKLLEIEGLPVSIVGDCYELLVFTKDLDKNGLQELKNKICSRFNQIEDASFSQLGTKGLINIKSSQKYDREIVDGIKNDACVNKVKIINPVLTVLSNKNWEPPFRSAQEMVAFAQKENKELWELAIMYEAQRSRWTEAEVVNIMKKIIKIMKDGICEALKGDIDMYGILSPTAGKILKSAKEGKLINTGVLDVVGPWAIATMEYSSAMGVVLCAPTGGSAGVIPGAVLGTANVLGLSGEEEVKAMLATAIIGVCMAKDCNFSAELYGCQVEPGAASAMAAGGLVHYLKGTAEQAVNAASIALQNILGLICDPVAGLVQIPCINRNVMASANAVTSANISIGGYDACIPLDEATETMFRVGKQLPSELRCTCLGGLCLTPTGCKLDQEQKTRDAQR